MSIVYLREVMTGGEIDLALSRIASEIIKDHAKLENTALVGIRRRGVPLAEALRSRVENASGVRLPLGILDITFYRDDLSLVDAQPVVESSQLDFEVAGRTILLVDDVLYTGRTVRAALESVLDYGRPARVELIVLVDRGHRELPIQADYVGKYIETAANEFVEVNTRGIDGRDGVFLTTKELLQRSAGDEEETADDQPPG